MTRHNSLRWTRIVMYAWFATLIPGRAALAQGPLVASLPATEPGAEDAWSRDVTPAQREQARSLFQEGARFIHEFLFEEAVDKYRQALTAWDHPAIHANMSMALIALGRPLDAYRSAQQALRLGPGPLGDDEDSRRRNYQNLRKLRDTSRAQLVHINVTSAENHVEVFIESEQLTIGDDPGSILLLPGQHRVIARKTGHETMVRSLELSAGQSAHLELTSVHRMTQWKPWAVVAAGLTLTVVGTGLVVHAKSRLNSLKARLTDTCRPPDGCPDSTPFDDDWTSMRWEQRVGIGSLILGGGSLVTGAALILWNRRRQFRVRSVVDGSVSITPIVSPTMTGVSGKLSF